MTTLCCQLRGSLAAVVLGAGLVLLGGCQSMRREEPIRTVSQVDLERFMGDWYVIANIPTRFERGAHNAVENYRLAPDGRILTTFTFRKGSADGPEKRYEPVGFVRDKESNAVWGMQFVWPFKSDYRIAFLDNEYRVSIIAREARDYVWVLSRTPELNPVHYDALVEKIQAMGYNTSELQRVPQDWP